MEDFDLELEKIVLKESIVGATGLNAANIQVGIKGDQSMRETAILRERYASVMDQYFPAYRALNHQSMCRRVSGAEYVQALQSFKEKGLHNGWIQEHSDMP